MMHHKPAREDLHAKFHGRKRQRNNSRSSFWFLLTIIFFTTVVFLLPQFHFEKIIDTNGIWWVDVIQHVFFFFFFCLILFRLLPFQKLTLSFFLFIFLFSAFFELLQKLLYEISFSYRDVGSNFIGISLAFAVYSFAAYMKMRPKKRKIQPRRK